jgi:hypothetical protein
MMMADLKMSETTLATFRSEPENLPPFRPSSSVTLRCSDCFPPVRAGGKSRVPTRPEASFTPDWGLLTTEPTPAVTRSALRCKLDPVPIHGLH